MSIKTIVAGTVIGLALGLVTLTLGITAHRPKPVHCDKCGDVAVETLHPGATHYYCNRCIREWHGPERYDFSWFDALETLASDVQSLQTSQ